MVIEAKTRAGSESQLSVTVIMGIISTILWLGGHRVSGLTDRIISGGVVSVTVMSTVLGLESIVPSFTTKVIVVVPNGN